MESRTLTGFRSAQTLTGSLLNAKHVLYIVSLIRKKYSYAKSKPSSGHGVSD
jgi:hypothetical protein